MLKIYIFRDCFYPHSEIISVHPRLKRIEKMEFFDRTHEVELIIFDEQNKIKKKKPQQ